jgi:membrane fusion protein, multidrug efflux system
MNARLFPWVIAACIALAAVALRFAQGDKSNLGAPAPAIAVGVTVADVQRTNLPLTISAVGRAEAKASVTVKSRLDGQVAEVAFVEGHLVHRGQALLRMDPAVFIAQERQAEGIVSRDEALAARLRADHERNESLFAQGFISISGLNQATADLQAAEATLKADRASLDNARLQRSYTTITAPMDGLAGAMLLPVGGAAKANDTALLVINQIDPIYVTFSLPESQLSPLSRAMHRGDVPALARIEGIDKPLEGKLAFIDNAVDPASGTIMCKALFGNRGGVLTPGQYAQVELRLDTLADVLVVPSAAVESGVDGPYAFVVNADTTVALRQLKVGPESSGHRVVQAGLVAGERVVLTGQSRLRDNAKVHIEAPAASASPVP